MSTPEGKVLAKIVRYLATLERCYWVKVHGSRFTINQPDLIVCYRGAMICIEVKAPGNEATPGQLSVLRKWARAGAITLVADSLALVEDELAKLT